MYKKLINILTVVFFLGILTILLICNFKAFKASIAELYRTKDQGLSNASDQVEYYLKSEFPLKSIASEGYGLGLLVLNKDIVGNYEYTKQPDGSVVLTNSIVNTDDFTNSVISLNEYLISKNIPLVYVQTPFRSMTEEENAVSGNDTFMSLMSGMCDSFKKNGVDVLDLNQNERIQSNGPVYFKSDVHATTEYEFASAEIILSYLEENYGLDFPEKENVFDINQYEINSYPFYGNTTFNTGHFYSPADTFNIYHPKYSTNMRLYDYSDGTEKTGNYDDVILNGYENNKFTDRTYWVTDYLRWPSPYYDVINQANEQAPRLLVICDSIYLRGCSFLSLASNTVTVYDPRFDNGYYFNLALSTHDYDAVIITGSSFYYVPINLSYQLSDYSAEVVSYTITDNRLDVIVLNNSNSAWNETSLIRCCLLMNNEDWGIRAYIPNGQEVAPGETFTFSFENIVESIHNADTVEISMLQEGVTYFGEREPVNE